MDNERLIAPKYKRLSAFLLDIVLVFMMWYLMTKGDLKQVDVLMETLDPSVEGALDIFAQALFKMLTNPGMIKRVSSNVRPTNSRSIRRDGDISSNVFA